MSFWKAFFSSCLGSIVALLVFTICGIVIFSSMTAEKPVQVKENSVLWLRFDAPITELELEDPIADIFPEAADQSMGLIQIKQVLDNVKNDPKIEGVYLNASYVPAGIATISEIRQSLQEVKEAGKWVVAYSDFYTEGSYYLASVADKVYLNPEGQVEFNGLSTEVSFYKKLFDKLEIKPQVFRVGDFKSAVEPFLREDLSEENKLQLNSILNSIYDEMLSGIAVSRSIDADLLKNISGKMMVRNAAQAIENKLVDSLLYEDQVKDELLERLGLEKEKKIALVKYRDYRKSFSPAGSSKNEIAVIVADGAIVPGKSDQGIVGATTITEAIRKARTSDRVKAIVIRINSPGGVFQSADEMWREVTLAVKEKPVIASMSDYAASGGYYLAMACDTIVARPATITGSIGVFSVLFDLSQFLGNKLGITSEEVKTGEIGELVTFTRPLTDVEKSIWQKQTDEIYETFINKAAEGRNKQPDEIKKIASGRVWTGVQAKDNGLVDVLGGFGDAVEIAAAKAGIGDDYKLRFYPQPQGVLEKFFGAKEEVAEQELAKSLGEYLLLFKEWKKVKEYGGVQARMGVEFKVR